MTYRSAFGDGECLAHGCSIMGVGIVQLSNQARRLLGAAATPKRERETGVFQSSAVDVGVVSQYNTTDHSEYPYTDHYVCVALIKQAKRNKTQGTFFLLTQQPPPWRRIVGL